MKQLTPPCHLYFKVLSHDLAEQVVLFHKAACESLSDEMTMELADWCHRSILSLLQGVHLAMPFHVNQEHSQELLFIYFILSL